MKLKLKVCGMRDTGNIREIAELNPDYFGFIFYKESPRYVGESFDLSWFNFQIKKVGVFVDEKIEEVENMIERHKLDGIQLHGNESSDYCEALKANFPLIEVWKVFPIDEKFSFSSLEEYNAGVDKYLFDTKSDLKGGAGKAFDWSILSKYDNHKEIILAGGIGLHNISGVIELARRGVKIDVIDINSRVEISPGLKSKEAIEELNSKLSFL